MLYWSGRSVLTYGSEKGGFEEREGEEGEVLFGGEGRVRVCG